MTKLNQGTKNDMFIDRGERNKDNVDAYEWQLGQIHKLFLNLYDLYVNRLTINEYMNFTINVDFYQWL